MKTSPGHREGGWEPRRRRALAALAAGALIAALLAVGCARTPKRQPNAALDAQPAAGAARFGPAYESLRRAAARSTDARAPADAPPPPGLDPALATPIAEGTPEGRRARLPLDKTLAELRTAERAGPERPRVTPQEQEAAVRRYVVGRAKLLDGDARRAIDELRTAARLDPGAPEPWRELGEAQLAAGSPGEAAVSLQAAVERGLREARALEFLGRLAEDRAEFERAVQWLAMADELNPRAEDPGLPLVVRVALGRCLLKTGRLEAGREALAGALDLPRRPLPTRYAQEVASVYRRQGELWREIGDADCRLGRYERALDDYTTAAALPAVENVDLAPRVFFAATRSGRPAAAAVYVLDRIASNGGFIARDDLELLSILAAHRDVARDLARALNEYAGALPPGGPPVPSFVSSHARARATVATRDEGREILRRHLSTNPADAPAAGDLLRLSPDPVAEVARLTGAHPEFADRYADALARAVPEADSAAQTLAGSSDEAARLAGVYLLTRIGRADEAWNQARALRAGTRMLPEAQVTRARLAAAQGRWADADAALAAIPPESAWARVRALQALRRPREALSELKPLLGRSHDDRAKAMEPLLLAAELAVRCGEAKEAEGLAHRASDIDPRDERPYATLMTLYGPGAPLADPDQLAGALRALREHVPDSRLVGLLRSQEFLRRSFLQPAERELRRLSELDPTDGTILEMLSGVWTRLAPHAEDPKYAEVVGWLDEQSRLRPWADTLVAAKARVMASAGRVEEAESLLRDRLRGRPTPEVARMLEILLRESGRAEEADRLAGERLSGTPLSIGQAIELAELRSRQERDADAAAALRELIPASASLEPEETHRVMALAVAIADRARVAPGPDDPGSGPGQGAGDGSREAAVAILDDLTRRRARLTPELHERRLLLLAATPQATEQRLLAAADDAVREYPQLGAGPYLRLSGALEERGRPDAARALMRRAASVDRPSPDVLVEWLRLVMVSGEAGEARQAIERAASLGQVSVLIDRLLGGGPRDEADTRNPRGVLAYILAVHAATRGRDDAAEDLYELCLEYDSGHPWANNNLGYTLLERDEDLERAERLLEAAYAGLPNSASVMDSLAWLRYKQGVLADVVDAESGRTIKHGAVPLLEAAARTDDGAQNQTILDHCGDALWLAGRKDEAKRKWQESIRRTDARIREVRTLSEDDPRRERVRREAMELRTSARRKIEAADRGLEPAVAPRSARAPAPTGPGE